MFAVSGIATILFLGGWNLGVLPNGKDITDYAGLIGGGLINVVVFVLKGWALVFVMMWVRWTLPRLRIDQVMMTCLKYLLPVSCFLLACVAVWQVAVDPFARDIPRYVLSAGSLTLFVLAALRIAVSNTQPMPVMTGLWDNPTGAPASSEAKTV
jgi:NADH-quinone oxidoreductase subunit H